MKPKTCFVICPIGDEGSEIRNDADLLHDFILKPVLSASPFSMSLSRADKLGEPGIITNQIIHAIETADLVVADLSMGNPNAFYEIAIRHVTRKPFIHLIRKGERIPFDNAPVRAIEFDLRDLRSVDNAKKELAIQVEAGLEKGSSESPVSMAATVESLRQSGNEEKIALADLLAEFAYLRWAVDRLQASISKPQPSTTNALGMFGAPQNSGTKSSTTGTLGEILAAMSTKDESLPNNLGTLADLFKAADLNGSGPKL
ncbi:hypothetical protein LZ016_14135 [Sphingomonas sp. SM33]|uniref:Nucleoside 2-deoxyribosyltransferase n=1 Tax=Sphingomonas telluris TaxID=2907998 RepID=A0ABS9VQL3_9SPHN|nr:hypothetical protein [Sphingomonas telluris]MCH8617232.1 hypothetical protein [Sphingomonas telluris]